ncbi:MAG: hypothetical protein RLN81_16390 [Balneolaceae bacterium]
MGIERMSDKKKMEFARVAKETLRLFKQITDNPFVQGLKCPLSIDHIIDFEIRSYQRRKQIGIKVFCETCDFAETIYLNTGKSNVSESDLDLN